MNKTVGVDDYIYLLQYIHNELENIKSRSSKSREIRKLQQPRLLGFSHRRLNRKESHRREKKTLEAGLK